MIIKILKHIYYLLCNPYRILISIIIKLAYIPGFYKIMTDETYLKICYYLFLGKKLIIRNPKTFNEKMQWLKLHDKNPKYTSMTDKYEIRKYIKNTLGVQYLVPLLGVYDSFDEIDFRALPNNFIIKCTHDSGGYVICKDKTMFNFNSAKKKINKHLKINYYYRFKEWPYKNVIPRIIIEKYMVDESGYDLKDYKFLCFNGEPYCLHVCVDRHTGEGLKLSYFDMNWNLMPVKKRYPNIDRILVKPLNFDKMIEISRIISKDIPFVRIDFYEIKGEIYFGEITFFPGSGFTKFYPEKYDKIFGNLIKL